MDKSPAKVSKWSLSLDCFVEGIAGFMRKHQKCSHIKALLCACLASQVDDGFWKGELNGQIGVFPSLVVELNNHP